MNYGSQTIIHKGTALSATPRLLYSYTEARELLGGVPVSTFALWIAQGLVVPVRIGPRRCFIKHDDLMLLAQGATLPKVG